MPAPLPIGLSIALVLVLVWGAFCVAAPRRAGRAAERLQGPLLMHQQRELYRNATFLRTAGALQVVLCSVLLFVGNRH